MKTLLPAALCCFVTGLTLLTNSSLPHANAGYPSFLATVRKEQVSVRSFFKSLEFKPGTAPYISAESSFSDRLISASDLDYLFGQINSKQKCKCTVSFLSSVIPTDTAELGGYAIEMIKAYKEQEIVNFGLYKCPKQDSVVAAKLLKWRAESKQKSIPFSLNKY